MCRTKNLNICYVAPDIPVPHTGTFVGGSTHTLKIAENLAKMGNNVYVISRRMDGQKKFERLGENLFVYRIYRGLVCSVQGTVSKKSDYKSTFIFDFLKNVYFLTIYRLVLIAYVARIIREHDINIMFERNSSKGVGVFTGVLFGIPSVVEV